jgi:alpha-tubulin suppressor-like RCC1 family protein
MMAAYGRGGLNASGQLGDGTTNSHSSPIQVASLTEVVSVDGGSNYSVALTVGGVLWIWGDNQFGQIGNGTNVATSVPVRLASSGFIIAMQSGASHTVALLRDGSTLSWGNNASGPIGRRHDHRSMEPGGHLGRTEHRP